MALRNSVFAPSRSPDSPVGLPLDTTARGAEIPAPEATTNQQGIRRGSNVCSTRTLIQDRVETHPRERCRLDDSGCVRRGRSTRGRSTRVRGIRARRTSRRLLVRVRRGGFLNYLAPDPRILS